VGDRLRPPLAAGKVKNEEGEDCPPDLSRNTKVVTAVVLINVKFFLKIQII
jgi:hypothetical protein